MASLIPSFLREKVGFLVRARHTSIAVLSAAGIVLHLVLRFAFHLSATTTRIPLLAVLLLGGIPLIINLAAKAFRREFGSDLLAGISIATAAILGEDLAGSIVVLMLSGGETLEAFALRNASSVLALLAKRMPSIAHIKRNGVSEDAPLDSIREGDIVLIHPHETCPVDGEVIEGRGAMDEAYLTGEPFRIVKIPGSIAISGAINGESALAIRALRRASDSRYAKIMEVMRDSEQKRPQLRRLGDQLGAIYTPIAVALALFAWAASGEAVRFLAVLVIATPCPLLIAIPVAIIGSISLAARRGIIVKDAAALEQIDRCRTAIFDKTGTLTYGAPQLVEQIAAPGFDSREILALVASLERYSKHPLAGAILVEAARLGLPLPEASEVNETPGAGLRGMVAGRSILITSRGKLPASAHGEGTNTPSSGGGGLECVIAVEGSFAALYRFRDAPRPESRPFLRHLGPRHTFKRLMILSGDRESEVRNLAAQVGITEIHAGKSPEEKVEITRSETARAKTLYLGDGINDAPAMKAATVGMAIGPGSDVTAEAAGVVVMEGSLKKVDEFIHIGRRMRTIALQSAVGGMALRVVGMLIAAAGHLTPVNGALAQEAIDILAVLNALRTALPPRRMSAF